MELIKFATPPDRIAAEAELLKKLHQAIAGYVGVMTVVQVIGMLELCKWEVREQQ